MLASSVPSFAVINKPLIPILASEVYDFFNVAIFILVTIRPLLDAPHLGGRYSKLGFLALSTFDVFAATVAASLLKTLALLDRPFDTSFILGG